MNLLLVDDVTRKSLDSVKFTHRNFQTRHLVLYKLGKNLQILAMEYFEGGFVWTWNDFA